MTWSEAFKAYIQRRFPERTQLEAAFSLKVSPSKVHYWCRGTRPVEETRKKIARWSKGEVPAELPASQSGEMPAVAATGTDGR